jgi:hypothetical protein
MKLPASSLSCQSFAITSLFRIMWGIGVRELGEMTKELPNVDTALRTLLVAIEEEPVPERIRRLAQELERALKSPATVSQDNRSA